MLLTSSLPFPTMWAFDEVIESVTTQVRDVAESIADGAADA